jgi:hypothetical protein
LKKLESKDLRTITRLLDSPANERSNLEEIDGATGMDSKSNEKAKESD